MFLRVMTTVPLHEPDADAGLITTLAIEIVDLNQHEHEVHAGTAEATILHATVAGPELWEACDARDGYLERLCSFYYVPEAGTLRDELELEGGELDLLYIEAINLEPAYLGRGVELAVVARLRDAFCAGVGIIVVDAATEEEVSGWARIGFVHSVEGATKGLMHLDCGCRTPRVVDELRDDDRMAFKVLPQPNPRRVSELH